MKWKHRNDIDLEVGVYYEIGYKEDCWRDESKNQFYHQGFVKFTENGFLDDNNYHIKPTPNYLIKLNKTTF